MKYDYRLGLSVLLACSGPVMGQERGTAGAAVFKTVPGPMHMAIAAQPVDEALNEFARISGLHVVIDSKLASGITSTHIDGSYTADVALALLLQGTGLEYEVIDETTISVFRRAHAAVGKRSNAGTDQGVEQIDTVTVYGRGAAETTVREVPQSTTVFDSVLLDSVAAARIDDVIRFLPSTSNLVGDFSFGNNFNVRGAQPSYAFNGMIPSPVRASRVSAVNVERVEVLMGPSSITYGSMAPGALINVVTKQPTHEFFSELELLAGSWDTYSGSIDIGGPLLGETVRGRLNASYSNREAEIDHWKQTATFIAPVIEFDLSDRTTLTLEGTYDETAHPNGIYDGRIPSFGTLLPNPNGPIPISLNSGYFEGVTHQSEVYKDGSARLKHEFNDNLSLNAQLTYAEVERVGIDGFAGALAANYRTMTRTLTPRDQGADAYTATVNIAAKFDTGAITHRIVAGIDYMDYRSYGNNGSFRPSVGTIPAFDAYDPDYTVAQPLILTRTTRSYFDSDTAAVYVQERAVIGDLSLIAGARYTDSQGSSTSKSFATGVVTRLPDTNAREWSTQFGALYNVTDAWMVYGNRSTSFQPRSAIQLRNGDFYGEPETASQIEFGARYIFTNNVVASLALYEIVRPDVLTRDPVDITFFIPAGELTSKGAELSVSGRLLPGWTALASYGYNPTEVTKSNVPGQQGLDFQNAPLHTATLLTRYDVSSGAFDGFGVFAGVSYIHGRFAEATNQLELPAATRVDLGLYYRVNGGLQFALHGNNITDEEIWSGFQTTVIARNTGRNYMFSVKFTPTDF